jgi:hypothetical protein
MSACLALVSVLGWVPGNCDWIATQETSCRTSMRMSAPDDGTGCGGQQYTCSLVCTPRCHKRKFRCIKVCVVCVCVCCVNGWLTCSSNSYSIICVTTSPDSALSRHSECLADSMQIACFAALLTTDRKQGTYSNCSATPVSYTRDTTKAARPEVHQCQASTAPHSCSCSAAAAAAAAAAYTAAGHMSSSSAGAATECVCGPFLYCCSRRCHCC